jgi:hypothetical protein
MRIEVFRVDVISAESDEKIYSEFVSEEFHSLTEMEKWKRDQQQVESSLFNEKIVLFLAHRMYP